MAFMQKDMRVLVNGFSKMWSYWTDDSAITVSERGYFDEFAPNLGVGDWVFATTCTGGIILNVSEIDPLELERSK